METHGAHPQLSRDIDRSNFADGILRKNLSVQLVICLEPDFYKTRDQNLMFRWSNLLQGGGNQ
jgi:hypothetical protein